MMKPAPSWTILRCVGNPWVCFALGSLVIQQLLVAASTPALSYLIQAVESQTSYTAWLWVYLGALTMPYLPGMISFSLLERGLQKAFEKWLMFCEQNLDHQPALWAQLDLKSKLTWMISRESSQNLERYLHLVYDMTALALNVLFNVMALVVWINPSFFLLIWSVSVYRL